MRKPPAAAASEEKAASGFPVDPRLAATLVIGIASLIVYTITLAPDVLAHDSGEWQATAATLGISHAPGSPLYTLIGYLFTLVPVGTVAARVNFLSAVVGAVGVAALFYFMLTLLGRWLPALVSAASLALAGLWWSHASVATPYNIVPVIIVICFIMLLQWQRKGDRRLVWGGALLVGCGFAYHPSLVYFVPVVITGVIVLGPWKSLLKPGTLIVTALLFATGLAFFAYLPIRSSAEPAMEYAHIDSFTSFKDYVTARNLRETGQGTLTLPEAGEIRKQFLQVVRDGYYPSYAFLVFGPAVLLLHPASWRALRRERRYLLFLLAAILAHVVIILSLSSIYAQYYLPLILYFSLWAGFSVYLFMGAAETLEIGRLSVVPVALIAVIYFGFLGLGVNKVWPFVDHSNDTAMRRYINAVFNQAQPGATVLADWESYTGIVYAREVDGQRRDLTLINVPREGWTEMLPGIYARSPSQLLLAHSTPFRLDERKGLGPILSQFMLSIKGKTYQDMLHGEPYPVIVQLFELEITASGAPVSGPANP